MRLHIELGIVVGCCSALHSLYISPSYYAQCEAFHLRLQLYFMSQVPKNVAFAIVLTSFEQDSVLPTGHKPYIIS